MDLDASKRSSASSTATSAPSTSRSGTTFGDCLAEDVSARYGTQAMGEPLHYDNRAAVVEFMSANLGPGVITMHVAKHPEIDV